MSLISQSGIYDVPADKYHNVEICDAPSISSTGLKAILNCPVKYWHNSPLNPARPEKGTTAALNIGKAAHDMILMGAGWPSEYHVTPKGFKRSETVRQADAIAEEAAAIAAGKTILSHADYQTVLAISKALAGHPFAAKLFANGEPEKTLVWRDKETGVWLRARPDFLPAKRRIIPDLKTTASAAPDAFSRAVWTYGYHMSAAHYLDGIKAIFGEEPEAFINLAIEKEPPFVIQAYQLSADDIDRGRAQNRRAIRTFADCLSSGKWPGYFSDVAPITIPAWAAKQVDFDIEQGVLDAAAEGYSR